MSDLATMEAYTERFYANQYVSGYGVENVTAHIPCGFCAAADFLVIRVIDSEEEMQRDRTCRECGRTGRCEFTYEPGVKRFEFVQTGGADPPPYLPPIRRVDGGGVGMSTSVAERVAAGVKWLDRRKRGWAEAIDLDALEMDSCGQCVLGQIFGDYMDAPVVTESVAPSARPADLGFDTYGNEGPSVWDELTDEWRRVIGARRVGDF